MYENYKVDKSTGMVDSNGNPIYTEKYLGCHITEIYRDPIDYSISEFSTIQILVEYQAVTYEANN